MDFSKQFQTKKKYMNAAADTKIIYYTANKLSPFEEILYKHLQSKTLCPNK